MADEETQQRPADQRDYGDRRAGDRRRVERRRPPPPWRRPWALVSYGVVGTLLIVAAIAALTNDDEPQGPAEEITAAPPAPPAVAPPAAGADTAAPPQPAYGAGDFERLVVEGPAAVGRRVQAELYCEAPEQMAVREVGRVEAALGPLIDPERRTVPAAECKWGRRDDQRREDFILLIPPELAAQFASAPEINDDFIRRRRLVAVVEWLGRSESLSLQTAGVFRGQAAQ